MYRAIGVDPTKLIAEMSGRCSNASTVSLSPWTTPNTPSGRPASFSHSATITDADGSRSEGFRIKAFPHASATGNIHIGAIAGKFEGGNAGEHAERLTRRVAIDASSDVLGKLALQQLRGGGREFHDFHTAPNFTDGVRVDLSMLGDDDFREFVDTFLENPEESVEYPGSSQGDRRRPSRRSLCCRSDSIRDIRGVRDRH